ncbi:hypothetical protein D910_09375 [Dendroctonus ponderosae]|nr:hypothetical protein D910_09375 [Dendroctonus ponderosae]
MPLSYMGCNATQGMVQGQTQAGQSQAPQGYTQSNYYMTPPSQHSDHLLPDNFPTPSPESPGHWSSSSPRSCNSDWSENVASPNTATYIAPSTIGGHQTNKGSDAIYI